MAKYNVVKYCRLCKTRFVVPNGGSKSFYCKDCETKVRAKLEKERDEEIRLEAEKKVTTENKKEEE